MYINTHIEIAITIYFIIGNFVSLLLQRCYKVNLNILQHIIIALVYPATLFYITFLWDGTCPTNNDSK